MAPAAEGVSGVGRWPHQGPGESIPRSGARTGGIDHLAGVVVPTVAVGVPGTQAPNEREDEREIVGRSPPPYAMTCTLDTSPTNSGWGARLAPHIGIAAKQ